MLGAEEGGCFRVERLVKAACDTSKGSLKRQDFDAQNMSFLALLEKPVVLAALKEAVKRSNKPSVRNPEPVAWSFPVARTTQYECYAVAIHPPVPIWPRSLHAAAYCLARFPFASIDCCGTNQRETVTERTLTTCVFVGRDGRRAGSQSAGIFHGDRRARVQEARGGEARQRWAQGLRAG